MADLTRQGDLQVQIVDPENQNPADVVVVDGGNALRVTGQVSIDVGIIPDGAVEVLITDYDDVKTDLDNVHVITNGKTLHIQGLLGSAEWNNVGGGVVELYYDPNGDGTGMTLIAAGHVNGTTFSYPLREEYAGDGTKAIRMRRIILGGGSLWIFGRVFGYEI